MGYYMDMTDYSFEVKPGCLPIVEPILDEYSFYLSKDKEGGVEYLEFVGEKYWDHNIMCQKIAPYVVDSSFIECRGEDGCLWRWVFVNGECHEINAIITWPEVGENAAISPEPKNLVISLPNGAKLVALDKVDISYPGLRIEYVPVPGEGTQECIAWIEYDTERKEEQERLRLVGYKHDQDEPVVNMAYWTGKNDA